MRNLVIAVGMITAIAGITAGPELVIAAAPHLNKTLVEVGAGLTSLLGFAGLCYTVKPGAFRAMLGG